jgi:hypothetical protein
MAISLMEIGIAADMETPTGAKVKPMRYQNVRRTSSYAAQRIHAE